MTKTLDETKVTEMEETMELEVVEEVEESKFKKVVSKAKNGVKTHGKKVLVKVGKGVLLFGGGLVIGALAKRGKSEDGDEYGNDETFVVEPVEVDFVEVEETTTV